MENQDLRRHHVAIQMEAMLANAPPLSTDECCIYKVPPRLRKLKQDAYTPKTVSIGPFHHGNRHLINMEGHKQKYCQKFIDERSEVDLDELVTCVQDLEPKVRRCYSENIKLGVDKFIKVILVDCCFVLEFLITEFDEPDEVSKPWLMKDMIWDLILLENQLPFFVFDKIYNLSFASALNRGQLPSFVSIASRWFSHWFSFKENIDDKELQQTRSILHFTDLYRYFFLSYETQPVTHKEMLAHLYSATELNEAGVMFRVNEGKCTLDLEFKGRRCIKIPRFVVSDLTEIELRNVMAFEQCHYLEKPHISYYVEFLDFLINTEKDVNLLVKKGIIHNWIGDDKEVAKMFNGLCKNILVSGSNTNYVRIGKALNAYHDHCCHSKMATLRRDYCNTPWRTAASVAGILLLILTIIQTICSILQVPHQQ